MKNILVQNKFNSTFAPRLKMDFVAQLVRASVCGSEGRGFETPRGPKNLHLKNASL